MLKVEVLDLGLLKNLTVKRIDALESRPRSYFLELYRRTGFQMTDVELETETGIRGKAAQAVFTKSLLGLVADLAIDGEPLCARTTGKVRIKGKPYWVGVGESAQNIRLLKASGLLRQRRGLG